MTETIHPNDRKMDVIFGQIELLSELATTAGDAELSARLMLLLNESLERYCDRKRAQLAQSYPPESAVA